MTNEAPTGGGHTPSIAVVVPVFNEAEGIPRLTEELTALEAELRSWNLAVEVILMDNASQDSSWHDLVNAVRVRPTWRAFTFTRNFGFQESILFGLSQSRSDAAVILQSDLQDPPEMIPAMVSLWQDGSRAIAGRATERAEGRLSTGSRNLIYRLMDLSSDSKVERGVQDFYLLDRRVITDLVRNKPPAQLIRTYVAEHFGFDHVLPYERHARKTGTAQLSIGDYYSLAMDGLLTSGSRGIRRFTVGAFGIAALSVCAFLGIAVSWLAGWRPGAAGWLSLVLILLVALSLAGAAGGLILEYLIRLLRSVAPGPRADIWETTPDGGTASEAHEAKR
jgi:dolichol-phosphate mannosyltransferase